jgi:two-component system, NarL family, invasion response regulator UvrY
MALRLLVVDDHTIFRAGITRLMLDEPDMTVTGQAADGVAALALMRSQQFDVVLMDINMGARNGLETLATLRSEFPRLPVIMLSMYVEPQYARLAHKARANAYLSKDVDTEELLSAIRHVAGGGIWVTPSFGGAPAAEEPSTLHGALTPREMQVMLKIAQGVSLTEIGTQLHLSVKTVGTHRSRVLEKLRLASNAELVQYAMRHRLVD